MVVILEELMPQVMIVGLLIQNGCVTLIQADMQRQEDMYIILDIIYLKIILNGMVNLIYL